MSIFDGLPFPLTVAALLVVVMLRANATYWLGRGAYVGAARTRLDRLLKSSAFDRAQRLVARWGAPVVTVSFLTVGVQTVVNLAAGAARMPLRRYLPAVTAGSVIWAVLYATVGFVTFAAWLRLYEASPLVAALIVVALIAGVGAYVISQLRRPDRDEPAPPSASAAADDRNLLPDREA